MIRIEKDKIVKINGSLKERSININEISFYLSDDIEIANDVTFERIFNIIIKNKELFNIVFSHSMGGYEIDQYLDDFNQENTKKDNDIDYCEVYRIFEHNIWNFNEEYEEDNELYFGFHGIGKKPEEEQFSFMLSSISTLKTYPIKINNNIKIRIDTGKNLNDKDVKVKDKYKVVHSGKFSITMFEFFAAILCEITWMGDPKNRDKSLKELEETSRRIDSGEEKTYPMEWDENGDCYIIKDGKKDYFIGRGDNKDKS